jgi:hypothetical protein
VPSLWFVVPAHGRVELARICLTQLRRTCDLLEQEGIRASAVVVADDENLDTARNLGFATVERDNWATSRKFNDGIQLALDRRHNPHPADYVVPCGSDDWVDHRLFLDLPPQNTMVGFQRLAVVREDGRELTCRTITTPGGCGIRIWPRALLKPLGYRPADPDRKRACDTSILRNVQRHWNHRIRIEHRHLHDHQIVDWKSPDVQLNPYETLTVFRTDGPQEPFAALAGVYPEEALTEMRALYAARELVAA